jgi:hypothetical protein
VHSGERGIAPRPERQGLQRPGIARRVGGAQHQLGRDRLRIGQRLPGPETRCRGGAIHRGQQPSIARSCPDGERQGRRQIRRRPADPVGGQRRQVQRQEAA